MLNPEVIVLRFKEGNCEQSGRRGSDQEALPMKGFGKWSGRIDMGMRVLRPVDSRVWPARE